MKNKFILLSFLAALISVGISSAQQYANCPMGGYGGMMYGYYGGSAMVLGWIISLLVIALIIAAVYWLIKSANRKK